jgi:2'-5' RNA ligase
VTSLLGVAIAVPDPWGAELERWRADFGDPQAGAIPAHITVLPPTSLGTARLAEVEVHLASAASQVSPFEVRLRGTGTFRPVSPVVFVALASGIAGCESLESVVRGGPLARELEHPYHPHVTVAHHVPDEVLDRAFRELAGFDETFVVRDLVLYTHTDGTWVARRAFPLGP